MAGAAQYNDIPAGAVSVSATPPAYSDLPAGATSVTPPEPGTLSKIADTGEDVAAGFVKGAGDTVSGISHLLNKIPGVGETLAPSAGVGALDELDTSKNNAQSVGKGLEGIAEFATGDAALDGVAKASKLVSLAQKYPLIARTLQLATEHPWLAKIITEGGKGAVVGGGEGAVKGAQQNDTVGGAATGALAGGAGGAVLGTIEGGANAVKNARVNPFREILKGKSIAQEPAEAAIREGVQEGAANVAGNPASGVSQRIATNPILENATTILDEPLKLLEKQKQAAYQAADKVAGFDLKAEKLQLKNDQYNLQQLGNTVADQNQKVKLLNSIHDSLTRIGDAETSLKNAGIDPKAADALNTSWKAGQDLKNLIVKNTAADGTINVDNLLKQSKNLRFSKRGDRLAQYMGKSGADNFITGLQSASDAGVHAMKVQKIAKWAAGLAATGFGIGAGAELGSHAAALLSSAP